MKAWLFVEGPADELGLKVLFTDWRTHLRAAGRGLGIVPLGNKANFLKKFGVRAAEKLVAEAHDIVVGLPDLYPTLPFDDDRYRHTDMVSIKEIQRVSVRAALRDTYGLPDDIVEKIELRLFPSAFRHDFEMLLLAAVDALRFHLGTKEQLGNWRVPVEDQDLGRPPKRVIEELFLTKSPGRKAYRDTKDAPAILRKVTNLRAVLRTKSGQWTCPEFVGLLRWLGEQTNVAVCDLRARTK
jgi:hypothetical protein